MNIRSYLLILITILLVTFGVYKGLSKLTEATAKAPSKIQVTL